VSLVVWQLASWPPRRWSVAAAVTGLTALATGIPTDVIPNPVFERMTPVAWWSYPVWAATALLAGLVAATYVRSGGGARHGSPRVAGAGGLLSFLAVGCPACNKAAVLALGASGATTYFGPVQPFLAVLGLTLLAATLALRLRGAAACAVAAG
jgi:hypothetical protein